jgi:hypothetical protein
MARTYKEVHKIAEDGRCRNVKLGVYSNLKEYINDIFTDLGCYAV